ncbi:MAG: undecaprenyl-diphosphate phosphatase [Betaproteobacteria bacterium]|nr:undecaprenyl-diphosphate phosphatase [Betaproteobacteria bacterium]
MTQSAWVAALLGVIEGITEYLPISSTGHLIIARQALGLPSGDAIDTFLIFIQAGSILGVCWHYRLRLVQAAAGCVRGKASEMRFAALIALATIPAVILGVTLHSTIKLYLFSPLTVAGALIVGGIAIIIIERLPLTDRTESIEQMSWKLALTVGLAQTLALFPGVSRSAATIMGGRLAGMSRRSATEFSFFLAIPVVFGAAGYDLYKNIDALAVTDAPFFAIGFCTAFVTTIITVRLLLAYIARYSFQAFGWYRIVVGTAVLGLFWN